MMSRSLRGGDQGCDDSDKKPYDGGQKVSKIGWRNLLTNPIRSVVS